MAMLLGVASLSARPALKGTVSVKQPDGTTVKICLHGDEYLHYNTTADGYSVVRNEQGYYVYARKQNGQLVATTLKAHDAGLRSAEELSYLQTVGKHLKPEMVQEMQQEQRQNRVMRAQSLAAVRANRYDYSKFKGLVLLIEYNDCKFTYSDYKDIMEGMLNQENYTGTTKTNIRRAEGNNRMFLGDDITCTGSMRDFFRDNSNGAFNPTFDIIGPVSVNRSQYYAGGNKHTGVTQLMLDACTAADSKVDFSKYDTDGDGVVDMIYFIFAGLPSYISGNNEKLLWPHQSDMRRKPTYKDGVLLGRYACSTELFGYEQYDWSVLEGIGTMCHEFSHVLGLPDFYDADYEGSGGQSNDVGEWSVMANGADFNLGRTPCAYSLFERYALGFASPKTFTKVGNYTLENLSESNEGFRMNTPVSKEYFMFENRQNTKWDAKLPGHGMLIFRVDSTSAEIWNYNQVNNNPKHNYYELVRAQGAHTNDYGYVSTDADPFPGTGKVTIINNTTSPANLKTWAGKLPVFGLRNIAENGGKITFELYDVNVLTEIHMVGSAVLGIGTTLQLQPVLVPETASATLTWTTDNAAVATVSSNGLVTGVGEGKANITVTAQNGVKATCQITVKNMPVAANIAAFCQMDEGSEVLLQLTNAQVLYAKGDNIYLRDATGSLVLSNTGLNLLQNELLSGSVYGKMAKVNRMVYLTGVDGLTNDEGIVVTEGTEAQPTALHVNDLSEHYYADMVLVKKAKLEKNGGMWAVLGGKRVRLFNTFQITSPKIQAPTDLTKRYDITAIFATNTLNGEVIDELCLLKSPVATSYTAPTAVSLPATLRLEQGRSVQLQPEVAPANADVVLGWASDNEQAVTVSKDGLLTAVADGMATITVTELETGLTAQCKVTVGDRLIATDIAAFKALGEGTEAELVLNNAQVLYVHNNNIYVRDASGAIILSGTGLTADQNQLLGGKLFGQLAFNNRMPLLKPVSGVTTADGVTKTSGEAAVPRKVKTSQLTDADLCDLVLVEATRLERDGGIFAVDGDVRARLWNTFALSGITVPTVIADKYFDVTAIFGTNVLNGSVIYELGLLTSPVEVDPSGITSLQADGAAGAKAFYDLNGRRLQTEPARGIYVVRMNGKYVKRGK